MLSQTLYDMILLVVDVELSITFPANPAFIIVALQNVLSFCDPTSVEKFRAIIDFVCHLMRLLSK